MELKIKFILTLLNLALIECFSQNSILRNAHSHNDYKQKHPLTEALSLGFKSIEADVFYTRNQLIVSHLYPLFKNKSLEELYLKPLLDSVQKNGKIYNNESLFLMIDIKSEANETYIALKSVIQKYKSMLTSFENNTVTYRSVTVILSGNKPTELLKKDSIRYMFIDKNLLESTFSADDNFVYMMASCNYSAIFKKRKITEKEKIQLKAATLLAHNAGLITRLWAIPDSEKTWKVLLECNLDLINADDLKKLSLFLRK